MLIKQLYQSALIQLIKNPMDRPAAWLAIIAVLQRFSYNDVR